MQEVGRSGSVVSDSCNPMGYSLPGSSVHGGSTVKNIGLSCLFSSPAQEVMTSCFFRAVYRSSIVTDAFLNGVIMVKNMEFTVLNTVIGAFLMISNTFHVL